MYIYVGELEIICVTFLNGKKKINDKTPFLISQHARQKLDKGSHQSRKIIVPQYLIQIHKLTNLTPDSSLSKMLIKNTVVREK